MKKCTWKWINMQMRKYMIAKQDEDLRKGMGTTISCCLINEDNLLLQM